MRSPDSSQREAERLLSLEGRYLDLQDWDAWLDLYADDAIYWVPSWKSEHQTTDSPATELSLIYYAGRDGLEDRVMRATSGQSPASTPLSRTVHMTSNIIVEETGAGELKVFSSWANHIFSFRNPTTHILFGRSEYVLKQRESWKITFKKTIIANDVLPGVVDFYHL